MTACRCSPAATIFDAPVAALREHLRSITTGLNSDGSGVLEDWSLWLAALLRGDLPAVAGARPPAGDRTPASGTGTYDDPWAVPSPATSSCSGGSSHRALRPPGRRRRPSSSAEPSPRSTWSMPYTAWPLRPGPGRAMTARDVGLTADNLATLAAFLTSSDGVVELVAQQPDPAVSPGWTLGTEVHAAHHLLPRDADVINQIRTQLTAWSPGAVLLVGPPFGSHEDWSDLLTAAGVRPGFGAERGFPAARRRARGRRRRGAHHGDSVVHRGPGG